MLEILLAKKHLCVEIASGKTPRMDKFGNQYVVIGESNTVFTAHIDTVRRDTSAIVSSAGKIYSRNRTAPIGGDDRCGVYILGRMIREKIPGIYCFFDHEEAGCAGSRAALPMLSKVPIKRCIAFDRRGTNSLVTHMLGTQTCSKAFEERLLKHLPFLTPDTKGNITDAYILSLFVPEVVNISAGFWYEHTELETVDIDHIDKVLIPALLQVPWEEL